MFPMIASVNVRVLLVGVAGASVADVSGPRAFVDIPHAFDVLVFASVAVVVLDRLMSQLTSSHLRKPRVFMPVLTWKVRL